jgi:hypothetical protein
VVSDWNRGHGIVRGTALPLSFGIFRRHGPRAAATNIDRFNYKPFQYGFRALIGPYVDLRWPKRSKNQEISDI